MGFFERIRRAEVLKGTVETAKYHALRSTGAVSGSSVPAQRAGSLHGGLGPVDKRLYRLQSRGASSKVEKEDTHYQGLPEDVGPDSEKSWSQRSRKMKSDKTGRSRK